MHHKTQTSLYTQGIAPIALILIVVLALAVGGGVVYVATQSSEPSPLVVENDEMFEEEEGEEEEVQVDSAEQNDTSQQPPQETPSVTVLSPSGGEILKVGQTYTVSWDVENTPSDAWVRLTHTVPSGLVASGDLEIHYTQNCFGSDIPASQGSYEWTISEAIFGCSDAGYVLDSDTTFQTKVRVELYTGVPPCDGLPGPGHPCITGTRTLHAEGESEEYFTITNTSASEASTPSPVLTHAQAEALVHAMWSDCSQGDCASVTVTVDQNSAGQYVVTAIFNELDDSVSQTKRVSVATYQNGSWTLGQPTETRMCHRGNADGTTGWTAGLCI